jgi:hypothetical protein
MSFIHSEHKIISQGNILSISFQHGNNSHAIIVIEGDVVAAPSTNKVVVKINPEAETAYAQLDNKGHYTCVFPSVEKYNQLVHF